MRMIYDLSRHSHTVTYKVESHKENLFVPVPDTMWVLRAECGECGWVYRQTITNRAGDPFTQYHRDFALMKHHLGIGMFVIPKSEGVGNDVFVREEDGSYWQLKFANGEWTRMRVEEEARL